MGWHVAGDWGTTRLRLFRMEGGEVVDRIDGPGIGVLTEPPRAALLDLLSRWSSFGRPDRIVLCGMAGARNGLREAPYVPCPTNARTWRTAALRFELDAILVQILAGVEHYGLDVMRGEETQIFGALARDPALAKGRRIFLLPGTHSKWAWVEEGRIASFCTFLTGELYALLTEWSSLLKAEAAAGDEAQERAGRSEGLERARSRDGLLGSLFAARAGQVLRGNSLAWARGFLSGLLIGTEIEEVRDQGRLPASLLLIGASGLADLYREALVLQGVETVALEGEACVLAGLELIDE